MRVIAAILTSLVVFVLAAGLLVLAAEWWTGRAFEPVASPLSAFIVLSSLALADLAIAPLTHSCGIDGTPSVSCRSRPRLASGGVKRFIATRP
jgi:hypothetical protein